MKKIKNISVLRASGFTSTNIDEGNIFTNFFLKVKAVHGLSKKNISMIFLCLERIAGSQDKD